MQCLSCEVAMVTESVLGITLDRCPECEALWFDNAEMRQLVPRLAQEPSVPYQDLVTLFGHPHPAKHPARTDCPRCSTRLTVFNYCYDSNIMLNKCPSCRGVWVDGGELGRILQYVKGHPKLDKMGTAIARHVSTRLEQEHPDPPPPATTPETQILSLLVFLARWIERSMFQGRWGSKD